MIKTHTYTQRIWVSGTCTDVQSRKKKENRGESNTWENYINEAVMIEKELEETEHEEKNCEGQTWVGKNPHKQESDVVKYIHNKL